MIWVFGHCLNQTLSPLPLNYSNTLAFSLERGELISGHRINPPPLWTIVKITGKGCHYFPPLGSFFRPPPNPPTPPPLIVKNWPLPNYTHHTPYLQSMSIDYYLYLYPQIIHPPPLLRNDCPWHGYGQAKMQQNSVTSIWVRHFRDILLVPTVSNYLKDRLRYPWKRADKT